MEGVNFHQCLPLPYCVATRGGGIAALPRGEERRGMFITANRLFALMSPKSVFDSGNTRAATSPFDDIASFKGNS